MNGTRRILRRSGFFAAGCILTGALLALILVGALWTPYDPTAMMTGGKLDPPSLAHLFGTDQFGRDIFSRVVKGAGVTALVAGGTVLIGGVCGTLVGVLTGYFGGAVDELLMRVNDTITAFPSILLALVCVTVFGSGKYQVLLVLGVVFIPSYARIARTAFRSLRDANFVQSARLMGAGPARILFVHMLPNTVPMLLPAVTIGFANAVLAEASMSFLGLCGQPPDASLGALLSEAQGMLATAPWYALSAGGAIVALIFGVGLIGEGLQSGRGERNA